MCNEGIDDIDMQIYTHNYVCIIHSSTAPSSPLNVTVLSKTPTSLLVTWVSPFIPNGVLTMYEVNYTGVSSGNPVPDSFFQPLYITASAPNTSLAVQHLVPYSSYTISVRAFTSAGPSEPSERIEDRTEEDGTCMNGACQSYTPRFRLCNYTVQLNSCPVQLPLYQ